MTTVTGQLKSIVCKSSDIRSVRNAALNIMEGIKAQNELYANLMVKCSELNLELDRMVNESQLNHLDRLTMHLANVEGDVMKAELLANTREQSASITKPHSVNPERRLPTERQTTKVGRFVQKMANMIG